MFNNQLSQFSNILTNFLFPSPHSLQSLHHEFTTANFNKLFSFNNICKINELSFTAVPQPDTQRAISSYIALHNANHDSLFIIVKWNEETNINLFVWVVGVVRRCRRRGEVSGEGLGAPMVRYGTRRDCPGRDGSLAGKCSRPSHFNLSSLLVWVYRGVRINVVQVSYHQVEQFVINSRRRDWAVSQKGGKAQ